jgi:hypothetical protein
MDIHSLRSHNPKGCPQTARIEADRTHNNANQGRIERAQRRGGDDAELSKVIMRA